MRAMDPSILLRLYHDLEQRLMSFEEAFDKQAQALAEAQKEIENLKVGQGE